MSRKNLKILLTMFLIIVTVLSCSLCFADEDTNTTTSDVATTEESTNETANTEGTETSAQQDIYNGDLYLFDTNVVMDKLVDGNVFICGETVEITGQVNGNLFVCANKLTFNNCYVRYSVFACAKSVYYNGACNDLYVATGDMEMTYDSYVVRDVKAVTSDVIFKAAVGRDVDLSCKTVNFGETGNAAIIYGSLKYNAVSEANIPEGVVTSADKISFNSLNKVISNIIIGILTSADKISFNSLNKVISNIIIGILTCVITVFAIYLLLKWLAPKFVEKVENNNLSFINILKALGFGLLSLIAVSIIFIILILLQVGLKLAFILITLFILLCLIAIPFLTITISNSLKNIFKSNKTLVFYLSLALVSIVFYGITLIPYAGGILTIIIKLIAIGMIINMLFPKKQLSEEEKLAIQERKNQLKTEKENKKREKMEAKEAKKSKKENN